MPIAVRESEVHNAFQRTSALLRRTYRSDMSKGEYGWYHYLDDPNPGVTASAVALICFELMGDRFERTEEVLRYLKNKQVSDPDIKHNGGWPVRTTLSFPIVESSTWVLSSLALNRTFRNPNSPDLNAGYEWVIQNQNIDYGWGSYYGQPSRTFHTSLSLLALSSLNRYAKETHFGADWLLKHQQHDVPAWGPTPESQPTILHTCWALLALSEIPATLNRQAINSSLDWVEANLNTRTLTETSSQAEDFDIPFIEDGKNMVYQNSLPHFCLPIAAYTLLKLSDRLISGKTISALKTIIEAQTEDGYWELPRSPTRPSIWAIWPFIAALSEFYNLSFAKKDTELLFIAEGIAIAQPESAANSFQRILAISVISNIWKFMKAHYGWIILVLFILVGLGAVMLELIRWNEFLLSLVFPIVLLIIQQLIERK